MLNATLGMRLARRQGDAQPEGHEPHERDDPAAHLRRHPEAGRRRRAALLREVASRAVRSACRPGRSRPPGALVHVSDGASLGMTRTPRPTCAAPARRRHRHRLELRPHHGVSARGRRAPARPGRQPCLAAARARAGRDRAHPRRGAGAGVRGPAGLPLDRPRLRACGASSPRAPRPCATPRTGPRSSGGSGASSASRSAPVRRGGGALRLPGRGRGAAGGARGALRPGRRQPAGGAASGSGGCSAAVSVPLGALRVSDAFLKSDPPTPREMRGCASTRARCSTRPGSRPSRRGRGAGGHGGHAAEPGEGRPARLGLPDPAPARVRAVAAAAPRRRGAASRGSGIKKRAGCPG